MYIQGMKKFHVEVYMPQWVQEGRMIALLNYTRHAKQEALSDRYGPIDLPNVFDSSSAKLIEAVIDGDKLVKGLYRQRYNSSLDLCLVLDPKTRTVVTVWLQKSDDKHETLDRSAYATN